MNRLWLTQSAAVAFLSPVFVALFSPSSFTAHDTKAILNGSSPQLASSCWFSPFFLLECLCTVKCIAGFAEASCRRRQQMLSSLKPEWVSAEKAWWAQSVRGNIKDFRDRKNILDNCRSCWKAVRLVGSCKDLKSLIALSRRLSRKPWNLWGCLDRHRAKWRKGGTENFCEADKCTLGIFVSYLGAFKRSLWAFERFLWAFMDVSKKFSGKKPSHLKDIWKFVGSFNQLWKLLLILKSSSKFLKRAWMS